MNDTVRLDLEAARRLVAAALERHRTSAANAACVADALVAAERDGQKGHGLSRVPSYTAQSASGKVDGFAEPAVVTDATAAVRVDAKNGFAFPAVDLAIEHLEQKCVNSGMAAAALFRSHHFGQAGYHVERLALRGMVALAFANSPKAIAPWGGRQGIFGTNPIAFAAPRDGNAPLLVDLSLSKVARGKILVSAESGEAIPEDWAFDADGNPTADPKRALAGTMAPMGEAKGAALVLMVEVLAAALTGANFGFEASSFFDAQGEPPGVGQLLVAFNPAVFSGGAFADRLESLIDAMLGQPGVRLPGSRRLDARARAAADGLMLPRSLYEKITALGA